MKKDMNGNCKAVISGVIVKLYWALGIALLCSVLASCQLDKSIVDNNKAGSQSANAAPGSDLEDGVWFKEASNGLLFAAKPNEETYLMVMQGRLFFRSTDKPLTQEQLNGLQFELRGANADLFTLQKKTLAANNPHKLPAGEHWVLIFNKDNRFFYDEVRKRCRICSATLVARVSNGTEAATRFDVKLLPVDVFSFTNIKNFKSLDKQARLTLNLTVFAKEGVNNQLYAISSNLVQGKGKPNVSLFGNDLKYDLDGNGTIDGNEQHKAAEAVFWKTAIPTALMFRQTKYVIVPDANQADDAALFNVGFSPADTWFNAIKTFDLPSVFTSVLSAEFLKRLDTFKQKQGGKNLPVFNFKAPVLSQAQRVDKSCNINGVGVNYYRSNQPYKVGLLVIPTDETASWLKINLKLYVVGSSDTNHKLVWQYKDQYEEYYTKCWDNADANIIGLPSMQLLPK